MGVGRVPAGAGAEGSGAGGAGAGVPSTASEAPQLMQKRASAGDVAPQFGQARGRAVPHAMQNRAAGGFSVAQLGQAIPAISQITIAGGLSSSYAVSQRRGASTIMVSTCSSVTPASFSVGMISSSTSVKLHLGSIWAISSAGNQSSVET
jgi:hypothetical protein